MSAKEVRTPRMSPEEATVTRERTEERVATILDILTQHDPSVYVATGRIRIGTERAPQEVPQVQAHVPGEVLAVGEVISLGEYLADAVFSEDELSLAVNAAFMAGMLATEAGLVSIPQGVGIITAPEPSESA